MAADASMRAAVKSASYNMVLQLLFRFVTFFMNAVLLRYMSREILGIVNVRLTLLFTTILFISREPFRKACLTRSNENATTRDTLKSDHKGTINLIWLCAIVGCISSIVLSLVWMYCFEQPSSSLLYPYKVCTVVIAISSFQELLVEPLWIYGQKYSFVTLKVVLEGIFVTFRCAFTVFLVVFMPHLGLYSFALSFFISSLVYLSMYYGYFWWYINNYDAKECDNDLVLPFKKFAELFPDWKSPISLYYKDLVLSFYKQSLIKQFLTEGERYVMTVFSILSFGEQGIYDVVNNLGSLAARFIFMPIEESYYTYFSQVMIRGKAARDHSEEQLKRATESLSVLLKFVSLVGLIILVFGYAYSFLLLDLYGGKILSVGEGPTLLKTYCFYVFVIAINGITECFMFALMSKEQINKYNYAMMLFSVAFLVASLILTRCFGSLGFILANCLNMLLRISQSMHFIRSFYEETNYNPLASIVPTNGVTLSLLFSFIITYMSEKFLNIEFVHDRLFQLLHVTIGGMCLLAVSLAIYFTEHEIIHFAESLLRKKKEKVT